MCQRISLLGTNKLSLVIDGAVSDSSFDAHLETFHFVSISSNASGQSPLICIQIRMTFQQYLSLYAFLPKKHLSCPFIHLSSLQQGFA